MFSLMANPRLTHYIAAHTYELYDCAGSATLSAGDMRAPVTQQNPIRSAIFSRPFRVRAKLPEQARHTSLPGFDADIDRSGGGGVH